MRDRILNRNSEPQYGGSLALHQAEGDDVVGPNGYQLGSGMCRELSELDGLGLSGRTAETPPGTHFSMSRSSRSKRWQTPSIIGGAARVHCVQGRLVSCAYKPIEEFAVGQVSDRAWVERAVQFLEDSSSQKVKLPLQIDCRADGAR